ncbi:AB hydrolase superfamily protein yfhM [Fibrisoma limi BUZ 3]|uniref:AB hydrolase superfamily protein yfhM n=1 Tax=Fibrisoma limi BUZ 3 TaxID=1185876 RepID=I2GHM8_9BACT|nr:alpha/beta hydrolase [Fibrisoma limi]CCH53403.1 AB hydrolase superfamily protein yfhM [Fibrisoma limi BUZ 3]
MQHLFIQTKTERSPGVKLHVVAAGPADGPLVILLHGFPEFWYGWRKQIDDLAAAGYRVWAPDQRGYNLSEKPANVADYRVDKLVEDVIGLIEAAGVEKAFIVGHDWGALVAWWLAMTHPGRIRRLVILNVPHPSVMARFIATHPRQTFRSWYIYFFQVPKLPEWVLRLGNWRALSQMMQRSSRPGTFSDEDMRCYREAWTQSDRYGMPAFRAMVNWYRAAFGRATLGRASVQHPSAPPASRRVTVPTLMIWGRQDTALVSDMAQPSIERCDQGKLVYLHQATHWVQHEEPARVNALLKEFLQDER